MIIRNENIYKTCYYALLILWLSVQILSTSEFKSLFSMDLAYVSNRLLILVILVQLINLKIVKKDFILIGFIFIGMLIYLTTKNVTIFSIAFLIFGARNLDFNQTIKICFTTQVSWVILIVLFSVTGVVDNTAYLRDGNDPTSARYALGFYYPTFLAHYFFSIVIEYIYLKNGEKLSAFEIISILFINILIYGLTDTKAVFFALLLLLLVIVLNNINQSVLKNHLMKYLSLISFPLFAILAFIMSYFYNPDNSFLSKLNEALSGRLHLGKEGFERLDFTLFGQDVDFTTRKNEISDAENFQYFFIDSSYLNIFFTMGIIVLLIVIIVFTWTQIYLIKNNLSYKYIALVFLALHSFADPQLMTMSYNILLFAPLIMFQPYNQSNANQEVFSYQKLVILIKKINLPYH